MPVPGDKELTQRGHALKYPRHGADYPCCHVVNAGALWDRGRTLPKDIWSLGTVFSLGILFRLHFDHCARVERLVNMDTCHVHFTAIVSDTQHNTLRWYRETALRVAAREGTFLKTEGRYHTTIKRFRVHRFQLGAEQVCPIPLCLVRDLMRRTCGVRNSPLGDLTMGLHQGM
jgi:hypothetical protein